MSKTMFALWALALGSGLPLSAARADDLPNIQVEAILVNDVDAPVATGKASPNAARLEWVNTTNLALVDAGPQSKFWIGLGCDLATEALKSQLGLAEKSALLVTMVAENSPAKTAGFAVHDVLTTARFGEETKPLDSVATLTAMVGQAEQKPLVLTLIRQGKSQDITVTPVERPQPNQDVLFVREGVVNVLTGPSAAPANPERAQQLLRELQAVISAQPQPTTIHFTGPVVAPGPHPVPPPVPSVPHIVVMTKPPLPDNVTVTISKTGKEPIRIKYQEGEGKVWGATETEINTLPPEGRSALHTVLSTIHHAAPQTVAAPSAIRGAAITLDGPPRYTPRLEGIRNTATLVAPPPAPADAAARLQAIERQMDILQKQQQELMTRQQESLRKELQSLREALEKNEKK